EPQDLCKNPRALPHFLPPIPLQKSMDGLRMVRSRVGQRILNQPARHGARSSGSRGGPESDRRAGLAWRRGHHAAPTFDEERKFGGYEELSGRFDEKFRGYEETSRRFDRMIGGSQESCVASDRMVGGSQESCVASDRMVGGSQESCVASDRMVG